MYLLAVFLSWRSISAPEARWGLHNSDLYLSQQDDKDVV